MGCLAGVRGSFGMSEGGDEGWNPALLLLRRGFARSCPKEPAAVSRPAGKPAPLINRRAPACPLGT